MGFGDEADGSDAGSPPSASDRRGGFFAVDRRAWARACGLGMNAAVAYLVLARGTGGDNLALNLAFAFSKVRGAR
jgi:hypothetical protein